MTRYISLGYQNQFAFTCPVFNAKTKMAACVMLRDKVWRGENIETRRGCQAAMACSMCPAVHMVNQFSHHSGGDNDFHGSAQPKEGKLHASILDRILRVIPIPSVLEKKMVSPAERHMMETAAGRIAEQLKTAPGDKPTRTDYSDIGPSRKRRAAAPKPKSEVSDETRNAARSGDLAAAISS